MMKNLDMTNLDYAELSAPVAEAAIGENADAEKFKKELAVYTQKLADKVLQDAKEVSEQIAEENADAKRTEEILASRGVRILTKDEKEYFSALKSAFKNENPQMALTNLEKTFPVTTINQVFEDLRKSHPLLDAINFKNYGLVTEFIFSTASGVAGWGELCAPITDELAASFDAYRVFLHKLSAFIPVCNAILEIGPEWLERFIRDILFEAASDALELAFVDGDGNNKPIGMTRKLSGAVDGVYPRKTAVPLTALTPEALSPILEKLATKENGKNRNFSEIIMVVNPKDYFTKIFTATTVRCNNCSYNTDVMPFPTRFIRSSGVPENHAVIGPASEYEAGLSGARSGKIEYSEHAKFLEDLTLFKIRLYATGRPKDETSFEYVDITNLKPTNMKVEVVTAAPEA